MAELPRGDADDGQTWCNQCQQWHEPGPCEAEGPWWEWGPDDVVTLGECEPTERELAEWEAEAAARAEEERAWAGAVPMAWLRNAGVN